MREVDLRFGFLEQFARCFTDHRDPDLVEHPLLALIRQRVFGICLGYEDLNDHDDLRRDPLLALVCGREDLTGEKRKQPRDRGTPLAGKSTLNRLELSRVKADSAERYKKIVGDTGAMQAFLVDAYLQQQGHPPERIVLDLDATDAPLHGDQMGRFFHGYYDGHCYLPLYICCGDHILAAVLRPADIDGAAGCVTHLARVVERIRRAWPEVEILVRGDSGFCREGLMAWCERNGVDYVLGLARNSRLAEEIEPHLRLAGERHRATGKPTRVFADFEYQTRDSWSRPRRVVGKAEWLSRGPNPRFVVTSLPAREHPARALYEEEFCGRGEMENRIKEQQLYLFADVLSCGTMRANQIRMLLCAAAYVVMRALREHGLSETRLSRAQSCTIRSKLLKAGAVVRVSVRRVLVSLAGGFPYRDVLSVALAKLRGEEMPVIEPDASG